MCTNTIDTHVIFTEQKILQKVKSLVYVSNVCMTYLLMYLKYFAGSDDASYTHEQ